MVSRIRRASGIEDLDGILDGLYIGDNVIWYDAAGSLAQFFCLKFMEVSENESKPIIYLSFDNSPKTILEKLGRLAHYPNLTVLDCFTDGKGASSAVFERFYQDQEDRGGCRMIRVEKPRDRAFFTERLYEIHDSLTGDVRLVFDSLTGMQELWGGEDQLVSFYSHSCPRLYDLETIAYWILEKDAHSSRLKARLSQIAQVVVDLSIKRGATFLSLLKAEDRETVNLQRAYPYWTRGSEIFFDEERRTAGGVELGLRIKALRTRRGLSQTELAKRVGVTPSTISQVESNMIYPSLPALLKMAEVMNVETSSFFKQEFNSRDRIVFSLDDSSETILPGLGQEEAEVKRLTPIDFEGKGEPYHIEIQPGQSINGHFFHYKGEEFGYLVSGRLDIKLETRIVEAEAGDMIYLTSQTPLGWKNPGTDPARLIWVKL